MKKILIAFAAIPAIFWFIWMAFPATAIQSMIEHSVDGGSIAIEVRGLKKGFFYSLDIDRVALKRLGVDVASFDKIQSRINPFGLLRMRLDASMNGTMGSGKISGNAIFAKNELQARFDYKDVDMREMPFLEQTGIRGTGTISGRFLMADDKGSLEFVTRNAAFEPADFSGVKVPMNIFNDVTGSLAIEGNVIEVVSIFLVGKDIYARLKGVIKNSSTDLAMELMPGRSFLENPLFLMEVGRYQVSPGYYVIPVRGKFSL